MSKRIIITEEQFQKYLKVSPQLLSEDEMLISGELSNTGVDLWLDNRILQHSDRVKFDDRITKRRDKWPSMTLEDNPQQFNLSKYAKITKKQLMAVRQFVKDNLQLLKDIANGRIPADINYIKDKIIKYDPNRTSIQLPNNNINVSQSIRGNKLYFTVHQNDNQGKKLIQTIGQSYPYKVENDNTISITEPNVNYMDSKFSSQYITNFKKTATKQGFNITYLDGGVQESCSF